MYGENTKTIAIPIYKVLPYLVIYMYLNFMLCHSLVPNFRPVILYSIYNYYTTAEDNISINLVISSKGIVISQLYTSLKHYKAAYIYCVVYIVPIIIL